MTNNTNTLPEIKVGDEVEVQFARTFGFGFNTVNGVVEQGDGLALGVKGEYLRLTNGDLPNNIVSIKVIAPLN